MAVIASGCVVAHQGSPAGTSTSPGPGAQATSAPPSPAPTLNVLEASFTSSAIWALTDGGLETSPDQGVTWRAVPVSSLAPSAVLAMAFQSDAGWLVAQDPSTGSLRLFRTTDAGASWSQSELPGAFPDGVNSVSVDALDGAHAWITIKLPFSPAESLGYALMSGDGGQTWSSISLPNGDPVVFNSPDDGWQAGGPTDQAFNRTIDGGKTWIPVSLPLPGGYGHASYSDPTFFGQDGVVPVYLNKSVPGPLVVAFYKTTDGGQTWVLGATVSAAPDGERVPAVVASPTTWLVQASAGLVGTSDGRTFSQLHEAGLSPVRELLAAQGSTFWARAESSACSGVKTNCSTSSWLEKSRDGGHTWAPASP